MANSLEGYSSDEIAAMAETYNQLLTNPATREVALRATKKLNPALSTPEIDLKDLAAGEFKKRDDKLAAMENELRMRDARDRITAERQGLRDAGHSADDVSAIEKIMTEKQIPSYQTAAEYYRGQQQIATPAPWKPGSGTSQPYSLPADALGAIKNGGLKKFGRDAAAAALNDIRSGQIKLH